MVYGLIIYKLKIELRVQECCYKIVYKWMAWYKLDVESVEKYENQQINKNYHNVT